MLHYKNDSVITSRNNINVLKKLRILDALKILDSVAAAFGSVYG